MICDDLTPIDIVHRAIFEQHDVQSRIGLTLLHHHFEIGPGEKVVEYGNVSTPWVVPDDNRIVGRLFTGFAVPRSWRFQDGNLRPYEYGFNVEGENLYDTRELPPRFVEDVKTFLEANGLDDTLGLCTMGTSNDARVEKTIGRVSITVPMETVVQTGPPLVRSHMNDYTEAVWSFDCIAGVESSVIKLARYCLWCPDEDDC